MPMPSIDRHYDQFTPLERLALFVEALARGDEAERDRLRGSCPRKAYLMTDTAFTDKVEFVYDVALVVAGDLRWHLGKLWIAELVTRMEPKLTLRHAEAVRLAFFEGYLLGQDKASLQAESHKTDRSPTEAEDAQAHREQVIEEAMDTITEDSILRWEIPEALIIKADETFHSIFVPTIEGLATELLSLWAAFKGFTKGELKLDPLTVMRAFCPPVAAQMKAAVLLYKQVKPDPEAVAQYAEGINRAWARCEGRE